MRRVLRMREPAKEGIQSGDALDSGRFQIRASMVGGTVCSIRWWPLCYLWMQSHPTQYRLVLILVPCNLSMGETGFAIETGHYSQVIIYTTLRARYKTELGRQEWALAVQRTCADGSSLPPFSFLRRKTSEAAGCTQALHDWQWSASTKGWTGNKHGLEWLRRVFKPSTREKARGKRS